MSSFGERAVCESVAIPGKAFAFIPTRAMSESHIQETLLHVKYFHSTRQAVDLPSLH